MDNLNLGMTATGDGTYTTNNTSSNVTWGNTSGYPFMQTWCMTCGQYYNIGSSHVCLPNQYTCAKCGIQVASNSLHMCPFLSTTTQPNWIPNISTTVPSTTTGWVFSPVLKNVKELTTDSELEYSLDSIVMASLKLPLMFVDCFLKVGDKYSPLYPLLISAIEGDSSELSFYIVTEITSKNTHGDYVLLEGVKVAQIKDNLTVVQLSERTRNYFKKDEE